MTVERWRLAGALAIVPVAYVCLPGAFSFDDAFIALHSARVLLAGVDPIYHTPALVGATSPPYVALLALFLRLGVDGVTSLKVVTALGVAAYVAGVCALGMALRLSRPRIAALLVVALASGYVWIDATNGIETGWAMALGIWGIVFALRDELYATAVIAGLLPIVRPDLAPASGLLFLYAVRRAPWRRCAAAAAIATAMAVPWVLLVHHNTGFWVPQTIRAKQFWFATGCLPWSLKTWWVRASVKDSLQSMLPLSAGLIFLLRHRLGWVGVCAMLASIAAYVIQLPTGLTMNFARYLYAIVVPWAVFGVGLGLTERMASRAIVAAVTVLCLVVILQGARGRSYFSTSYPAVELVATAQWVDAHVPAGATLLVHDAGAISEFAHHPAVDLVGLKTPSSVDAQGRWTWATCGRDRRLALAQIAATSGASYVVISRDWDHVFRISYFLKASGFELTLLRQPPRSDADGYFVYRLVPPHLNMVKQS